MTYRCTWSLALLLAALLSGCSSSSGGGGGSTAVSPAHIRNSHPGTGGIAVVGDSLAAGMGAADPANQPSGCLKNFFNQPVSDFATPGLTSEQILGTEQNVIAARPKLIFVSAGGNDAILDHYRKGVFPVTKSMQQMTRLFDDLLATGAVVVYLGLNPPYPDTERLPQISTLANSKGILVVDGMKGLWSQPDKMHDEFHPNDEGYKILCQRLTAALKDYYP